MHKMLLVPAILLAASASGAAFGQAAPNAPVNIPQQAPSPLSDQQLNQQSGSPAKNLSRPLLVARGPQTQAQSVVQAGVAPVQPSLGGSNQGLSQGMGGLQVGLTTMTQALGPVS